MGSYSALQEKQESKQGGKQKNNNNAKALKVSFVRMGGGSWRTGGSHAHQGQTDWHEYQYWERDNLFIMLRHVWEGSPLLELSVSVSHTQGQEGRASTSHLSSARYPRSQMTSMTLCSMGTGSRQRWAVLPTISSNKKCTRFSSETKRHRYSCR